ncbi:MAG: phage tail protein [Bacteroidota bacterium]
MDDPKKPPFYYPPVSFHFKVTFKDVDQKDLDIRFQSVSGLEAQLETETIKEGGENRFTHQVPTRRKYSDLVLKRGVLFPDQSDITRWCQQAFEHEHVEPINLDIWLLNSNHDAILQWKVINAWPKSWKFNELNAEKGEIFLETLTLAYNRFEVK